MNIFIFSFICILISSVALTAIVRVYAKKKALIDIPNHRSSHTQPTPRGGGVSISLSIMFSIFFSGYTGYLDTSVSLTLFLSIMLITIVGWLDDHKDIDFYWRFLFYSIAAVGLIYQFGSLEKLAIGSLIIHFSSTIGTIVTFLSIVWLTNLYNFMDGTDGLAALQAICAGLMGGALLYLEGEMGLSFICFMTAASSIGFLYWNFPPAKIFMGDIGSCVLGFIFAALALLSDLGDALSVTVWCLLLSVFICDATFTLIKRVINKEKWYSAHRSHAYQLLVQTGCSHRVVAIGFIGINVFFIWPIVLIAYLYPDVTLYLAIITIISMFVLWILVQLYFFKYLHKI